jgi:hypothetical protein
MASTKSSGKVGDEAECIRNSTELFVARPKNGVRRDQGGGK